MATTAQTEKLRRRLQDFYDKDGNTLATADQAFNDTELGELIDDAFLEVTDGARTSSGGVSHDEQLAMIVSRADGLLMLAQDESRRLKWTTNNKIVDQTETPKRLIDIAKELRMRYDKIKDRELKEKIEGVSTSSAGGVWHSNDTVKRQIDRNFRRRVVTRNDPRGFYS